VIPNLFNATTLPALTEVVGFTQARQNLLTGNLANYGTPGYKVRDLSLDNFQSRLKEAIHTRDAKKEELSPGIIGGRDGDVDAKMRRVRDSFKDVLYHDQTNVSLEHQINEVNKNQLLHNTAITVMTSQFRLLQTAISERV
jgi:flagellar basal-body rod protein FlgB